MDAVPALREQSEAVPPRLSRIFCDLAAQATGPVSIGEIRDALGARSFATLLVLFAIINLIPAPPGTTLVLGLPLLLVSGQMVLGRRSPWLPGILLNRAIGPVRLRKASHRLVPTLRRLEQLVRPRKWPFVSDRLIGLVALILSLAVTVPIPLGNWLPAFAVAMIGLALSERDGIFLGLGFAVGVLSLALIGFIVGAAGAIAGAAFGMHF